MLREHNSKWDGKLGGGLWSEWYLLYSHLVWTSLNTLLKHQLFTRLGQLKTIYSTWAHRSPDRSSLICFGLKAKPMVTNPSQRVPVEPTTVLTKSLLGSQSGPANLPRIGPSKPNETQYNPEQTTPDYTHRERVLIWQRDVIVVPLINYWT